MNMQNARAGTSADHTNLFKILAASPVATAEDGGKHIVLSTPGSSLRVEASRLVALVREGLVARSGKHIALTETGRNLAPHNADVQTTVVTVNNGTYRARNEDESPLTALMRRRSADGKPFLNEQQFEAGERLRSDFTRANLMPRVSANWQASVSSGRRAGDANGIENLTNSALEARFRVEAALDAIGYELAGVASDICCFIKGFEQVEMERQWPKRSAKFLLRAALTVLAQHYNPQPPRGHKRAHKWGADDYRPTISRSL